MRRKLRYHDKCNRYTESDVFETTCYQETPLILLYERVYKLRAHAQCAQKLILDFRIRMIFLFGMEIVQCKLILGLETYVCSLAMKPHQTYLLSNDTESQDLFFARSQKIGNGATIHCSRCHFFFFRSVVHFLSLYFLIRL